jgi:formyltetrahydrofolate deformylase
MRPAEFAGLIFSPSQNSAYITYNSGSRGGVPVRNSVILLVQCPDRKGLDATIAEFIYRYDGNILHFEQHQVEEQRYYLARVEWSLEGFRLDLKDFDGAFGPVAHKFGMNWCIRLSAYRPRVAIFVSKYDHCLVDLLYRQRNGELPCDFPLIISNHPDTKRHADFYSVPFHCITVTKEKKEQAEARQLELLQENNIDLVVLARYMQVLSSSFIAQYPQPIINIHHSFLPAFVGAKPHQQAHDRGVKLTGATAHYVTEILDDGPIIEQGVVRISHRDSLEDMVEKGRDVERVVLSRAVRWHVENRILLYGNRTIIFE